MKFFKKIYARGFSRILEIRELKIKSFIFPKKILKFFPCYNFFKFLFSDFDTPTLQEHVALAEKREVYLKGVLSAFNTPRGLQSPAATTPPFPSRPGRID